MFTMQINVEEAREIARDANKRLPDAEAAAVIRVDAMYAVLVSRILTASSAGERRIEDPLAGLRISDKDNGAPTELDSKILLFRLANAGFDVSQNPPIVSW